MDFKERLRILQALRPLRPWPMHPAIDAVRRRQRAVDYLLQRPDVEVGEVVRLEVKSWEEPARILGVDRVAPEQLSAEEAADQGYRSLLEVYSGLATQSLWAANARQDVYCVRWELLSDAEFTAWWPPRRVIEVPTRGETAAVLLYAEIDRRNGEWFGHAQPLQGSPEAPWGSRKLLWDDTEPHYLALLDRMEEAVRAVGEHALARGERQESGIPLFAEPPGPPRVG